MRSRNQAIAAALALLVLLATGCSSHRTSSLTGADNQSPVVQLERPASAGAEAQRVDWNAHDVDGTIDHYEITVDPNAIATGSGAWERTESRSHVLRSGNATPGALTGRRTSEPRFFGVRAVDDRGGISDIAARAYVGDNIAPTVQIVAPRPSRIYEALLENGSAIRWEGTDPDAQTGKPLEYRYLLLDDRDQIRLVLSNPDTLRSLYGPEYETWRSVGHRTELTLEGLTPLQLYLLIVIAFDEQGDATALFSRANNMLVIDVVYPGVYGPVLTVFGAVSHQMSTGGVHDDPGQPDPRFDVPADQALEVGWYGTPPQGHLITGYRWALDPKNPGEPGDDRTRGDWSKWSLTTTTASFGPLAGGTEHRLYIEARTDGGLVTRLMIILEAVATSFDRDVLIVDDMRLTPDRVINGVYQRPSGAWPNAAELDTFLYARGGFPWQGAYADPANGGPYTSSPGIFNGYSFDTLGTRSSPTNPVTLELLGRYRHVIWMVDYQSATLSGSPSLSNGSCWLAVDPQPLASYIQAGGKVWLVGACGLATMKAYNRPGTDARVFSDRDLELVPGRFVYDYPHWRSELTVGATTLQLDRFGTKYASFPESVIPKQVGSPEDDPPPLRLPDPFWYRKQTFVEYISRSTMILESGASVLDTVYKATVSSSNPVPFPMMTVYRGSECGQVVMTGVDIWGWSRSSCVGLVDGVLQGIWGLHRDPGAPRVASADVRHEPAGRRRR